MPKETPEQRAELARLGIRFTPYHLPVATMADQAMAWEILGRYVEAPSPKSFGGTCLALGRQLEREKPWWRRLFNR